MVRKYERVGRILGSEEGRDEGRRRGLIEGENTAEKATEQGRKRKTGERRRMCRSEERERRTGSNVADYRPDPVGRLRSGNPFYRRAVSPATRRSTQRRRCDRCDGGTSASHDSVLALPSVSLFRSYNASECYLTSSSPVIHYTIYILIIIYTQHILQVYTYELAYITHTHTHTHTQTPHTYMYIHLSIYHFLLSLSSPRSLFASLPLSL